ncbi:MAG TPA: hypothetical protein VHG28_17475 [Longimicrobiaceae bacterium]|nr:hypothetical protein [Longimicrobiaceae bacterium]
MPPLQLDHNSLVAPGEHVLHVLTRRGYFDLKARDIHRLHDRLHPFLHGSHEEADLLAAVPGPQMGILRTYLGKLREVGVLRDGPPEMDAEAALRDFLESVGEERPRASAWIGEHHVYVSLDGMGPAPADVTLRLCFVTPGEARRLLQDLGGPESWIGRLTCVLVEAADPAPSAADLQRRARYARWLLRNELDVRQGAEGFQMYRLNAATGALERTVVVEGRTGSALRSLPDQLGVVRLEAVEQLPLVVATAGHPMFEPTLSAYGLTYPALREHLLRAFLAGIVCCSGEVEAGSAFRSGALGSPLRSYIPVRLGPGEAAGMSIAARLSELQMEAAERLAEGRMSPPGGLGWQEVDLLREASGQPTVARLQDILRLRAGSIPGETAVTAEGLVLYRSKMGRSRSFLRARAVGELLLAHVQDQFYPDLQPPGAPSFRPACRHLDFSTPRELRRILRDRLHALSAAAGPLRIRVLRIRRWGIGLWMGDLSTGGEA